MRVRARLVTAIAYLTGRPRIKVRAQPAAALRGTRSFR